MALRLVYLADIVRAPVDVVTGTEERYHRSWNTYVRHGAAMQSLAALITTNFNASVTLWNAIDQPEVDAAFSTVICEREPFPRTNLATLAMRQFELDPARPEEPAVLDRKLTSADNEAAWVLSPGGACRSCATPTISQRQHDQIKRTLRTNQQVFDLLPSYHQTNGREAPLWSSRVLIAAKGVADHVLPWAHGGRTCPDNLANVCAACNYSRSSTSLDVVRVATYT